MKVVVKLNEEEIKKILEQHVLGHPSVSEVAGARTSLRIDHGDPGHPGDSGPRVWAEIEAEMFNPPKRGE